MEFPHARRLANPGDTAPSPVQPSEPLPRSRAEGRSSNGRDTETPRAPYITDLSDEEWTRLAPLIPPAKPGGRPRDVDLREIVNAAFYKHEGGCSWRLMPHDLPPWQTVYSYVRQWKADGTWERLVAARGERPSPDELA